MKRIQMLAVALLASGATIAAWAAAPLAAQGATVQVRETTRGKILVDEAGFTLYYFTLDKKHQDHCITIEMMGLKCPEFWPPLEVTGMPTAGEGIKAKSLGTTELPGGAKQVTFKKKALYTYVGDAEPGATGYIGALAFGGYWYGLSAKGMKVK
jgi:predicted lipoprotein with Yx(FWY)xxD motif